MKEKIRSVIEKLKNPASLDDRAVTVGFDGFVDSIVRVLRSVDDGNSRIYFQEISEFGKYIQDKNSRSCSFELDEQYIKIGGNMPIFANALGSLGVKVNCIGAMGHPEVHEVFGGMSPNCTLYSVARPGYCTALEFRDGKIMMANNTGINSMSWQGIKEQLGMDKLVYFYGNSSILGMFNWSEIDISTSIWEGIIRDILPLHKPDKRQTMYFDLSDCSKRDQADINHALELIGKFNEHYSVTLSLNENETVCLFNALIRGDGFGDPEYMGDMIYERLLVDRLIIHPVKFSAAWDGNGKCRVDNLYIEDPKLSTGGGDNFNAGICLAQLMGLDTVSSLILANAASGYYVKNGYSADINGLIDFLKDWQETL